MNEDDVNEDVWYFDSIKRYELLSMFELERKSYSLALTNSQSICLVSYCQGSHSELLEFQLPTIDGGETRDLKFKCGKLFKNEIFQIGAQYGKGKIIVSEENIDGISVYALPEKSGSIERVTQVKIPIASPRFAVKSVETPHLFISKDSNHNGFLIDIDASSISQSVSLSSCIMDGIYSELAPLFVEKDLVALCNIKLGCIALYDLRTNKVCLHMSNAFSDGSSWTFDSKYNSKVKIAESHNTSSCELTILSNNGCLMNFDSRNWKQPLSKLNVNLKTTNPSSLHLNFNPNIDGVFSFAGFDSNVYVYRTVSDGFEHLFTHDGHSHIENCDKDSIVLAHAWTNCNSVVSCAQNKTLHLWKYSNNNS